MRNTDDLETLRKARPYLRSLLAFFVHLRSPEVPAANCYVTADQFLVQLEHDIKRQAGQ